ncbi:homocysteine S-methyltransferase family protein [Anaerofustis stercorihominis]|uniref:Methionine synthase n=1 Tax=Anaerofustis stercorihominis TaxID=214853 RepID=A0A3E3DWP4_9FIRM|nr:homocysteine S-methyltransferase family protein [Anaerofustis stercorihominis]MCQ4794609.1 homocysteine S-methyltransferase family protein [Anaerofustis stercorihominis]RGD73704.1 homocysteine methyltransferase [Anaerofustis stercorihominis]
MDILKLIKKRKVFFDGGMGSLLQEKGLKAGEFPEMWNVDKSDVVKDIHKEYLLSGADIISANTFGCNSLKFDKEGTYSVENIIRSGVRNAKEAVKESGKDAYVALDIGPTGKLLKPLGDLDFNDAYEIYKEIILFGVKENPDIILIETMSDGYEAKAAILAAKENCDLPVFVSMTLGEDGKLLTGGNAESIIAMMEGLRVDIIGLNCGLGPLQLKPFIGKMLEVSSTPLMLNPNAGLPRSEGGKTVYDINSGEFAFTMKEIADMGVSVLGGCCGTTPEHIKKTVELCKYVEIKEITKKDLTMISSFSKCVYIDKDPIIIGERINPTGKKRFKQALIEDDIEYVLNEANTQVEAGAHVLDVNVGLPEINEAEMMEKVIKELQFSVDVPLQVDTSNTEAMERALRLYNGKALINSVNGKKEVMDEVFPLVKKYGGVVVALCLDEDGIPSTAKGRIKIANKIIKEAEKYGIERKDIIIDALAMTVSADTSSALVTLDTLSIVKNELKMNSVLGVSNISFGLPNRMIINSVFFAMALDRGLNAAIINPNNEDMMRSYISFRTLSDMDEKCMDYIDKYASEKRETGIKKEGLMSLEDSIVKGMKERAKTATLEELEKSEPLEIINKKLIPSLDIVGKGFEEGTIFLPQLLMSAEAAKAAFNEVKNHLVKSGQKEEKIGKIVIATVKGDIHDIGKNIVKVLLENYGYDVIDLGKDVDPDLIVNTVIKEDVKLVGLSALMTTTVPSMEETIKKLNKKVPDCKVFVGGAVLTKDYAKTINADYYAKDAMASVAYAENLFKVAP